MWEKGGKKKLLSSEENIFLVLVLHTLIFCTVSNSIDKSEYICIYFTTSWTGTLQTLNESGKEHGPSSQPESETVLRCEHPDQKLFLIPTWAPTYCLI